MVIDSFRVISSCRSSGAVQNLSNANLISVSIQVLEHITKFTKQHLVTIYSITPAASIRKCNYNYTNPNKITKKASPLNPKLLKFIECKAWPAFCNPFIVNGVKGSRMMSSQKQFEQISSQPAISLHAQRRMGLRGVSEREIELVLKYGRRIHSRRTVFHVIGRKEIKKYASEYPELKELDGLHVLTVPQKGTVLTAYRNHDLRHIRPSKRKHKHLH